MDKTTKVLKQLTPKITKDIAGEFVLPNHSGDHSRGIMRETPQQDDQLVNKAYVDTAASFTVVLTMPTGLQVSPISFSGGGTTSLTFSYETGYSIPTDAKQSNWDTAYGWGDHSTLYANKALSNLASVAINTSLLPGTSDGAALGSTTKMWSDLFLASGGVIDWNNGDVTLTHSANNLKIAGGNFRISGGNIIPDISNSASLGTTSNQWSDLFLASGGFINWNNGDVKIGHSSNYIYVTSGDLWFDTSCFCRKNVSNNITANVAQTQGTPALTGEYNRITTCANAGDSVTFPTALAGKTVIVTNDGANSAQLYPYSGDDLGAGVNTPVSLAAGASTYYICLDATNWRQIY